MISTLELLAPARNARIAIDAINHGADAVYIGGPDHGARASAGNTVEDIAQVCSYAHKFGARVYVTLNTIVYDDETTHVQKLVNQLYHTGVDALIVQDMAILRMNIPPIALHASTQCDTRTPEQARFLQEVGFSQIVIARECSLEEISQICTAVDVPVETFVHGALCVSYSGDCYASYVATGRSANRGECAQMCRLPYDLVDADTGEILLREKHLLSLRDMQRLDHLAEMVQAGARSFKIEGRLKDSEYVKNVVAAYSNALDKIVAANPDKYRRLAYGSVNHNFTPATERSFNRGFTPYFLRNTQPEASSLACFDTPKSIGIAVGTVRRIDRTGAIIADLNTTVNNGDGIGWFDKNGKFNGFRVNRAEVNRLFRQPDPASKAVPSPGTTLYRNSNSAWQKLMSSDTATRFIPVDMHLRTTAAGQIVVDISDCRGCSATASVIPENPVENARSPQADNQRNNLSKLGNTVYRLCKFTTEIPNLFVPNSILVTLRRRAIELLDKAWEASRKIEYRRKENTTALIPESTKLTYRANVANSLARDFYTSHGATNIEPALETQAVNSIAKNSKPLTVMQTRYCIRRELGACLKNPSQAKKLPKNLVLRGKGIEFALDFDCHNCRMNVIKNPNKKLNTTKSTIK